ncbi:hypothetical protein BC628DRAFT_1502671 [Trametes gibbosa]|nr:hypothetical protein BC628DRAFT_1502671 [Trametes gibbosa]
MKDLETAWHELEKFQEAGYSKSIGVSNFDLPLLQMLVKVARVTPAVNQCAILFHPYNYAQNKDLLEFSAKHSIITEAYSNLQPITKQPGGPVDKRQLSASTPLPRRFFWRGSGIRAS